MNLTFHWVHATSSSFSLRCLTDSLRVPDDYARRDGNARIDRRCHSELSKLSRLSKPQIIAATSRVTRSATKMTNRIMVFFFLVLSAFSCTKMSASTYAWIPVFPTSVLPEKARRSYDLEHSVVVSLQTKRRSL
jgi:hypothetical protein